MNVPYWLLRLLPMWEYICPKCRKTVKKSSHECPHCGERFPLAIRVPPSFLKDSKKLEEYVHKHIFPRVSAFERNYLIKYFTVIFEDGQVGSTMETQSNFDAWTTTSASSACSITVETDNPHHGENNAEAVTNGASKFAMAQKDFTGAPIVFARAYLMFGDLPTADATYVGCMVLNRAGLPDDWHYQIEVGVTHTGGSPKWSMGVYEDGVGTDYYAADGPSTSVYYCVDILRDITNDLEKVWINNVEKISATQAITVNSARVSMGITWGSVAAGSTVRFDCVVVADAPIGPESSTFTLTVKSTPVTNIPFTVELVT